MKNISYSAFNTKRKYGIELEVNHSVSMSKLGTIVKSATKRPVVITRSWDQTANNPYWHIKKDNSCGYEVVSFVGSGIKDLVEMGNVANFLKKECQINEKCGFHCHVDVSDFNVKRMGVLIAWWLKIEEYLCNCMPDQRINNYYCRPLSWIRKKNIEFNHFYKPEAVFDLFMPMSFGNYENADRRTNMNLVNYVRHIHVSGWKRCTVEFRWPEATLDGEIVKNWIRLFVNFVEKCKTRPMPKNLNYISTFDETMEVLGLGQNDKEFIIYSKGLFKTKNWLAERKNEYTRSNGPVFELNLD